MATFIYSLFVNGELQSKSGNYDWMFQRGLALAMYLKIDHGFINTGSSSIMDKWSDGEKMVLITKSLPELYTNDFKGKRK